MEQPTPCWEPSFHLHSCWIFSHFFFNLEQADQLASHVPTSFFSPSHVHGSVKQSFLGFFFLYTYLKCYHRLQACCPSHKDDCETGTETTTSHHARRKETVTRCQKRRRPPRPERLVSPGGLTSPRADSKGGEATSRWQLQHRRRRRVAVRRLNAGRNPGGEFHTSAHFHPS